MKDHQKRVIEEKEELEKKINKLNDFIFNNCIYADLEIEDQNLLMEQLSCMSNYYKILAQRISRFDIKA